MLKIDINKDKDQSIIEGAGAGGELLAELAMAVNSVYSGIHNNDPMMASAFKHLFIALVSAPDSPVLHADKAKMADGSYCIMTPVPGKDE